MKRKALSSAVYSRLTRAVCLADFGRVVQSKFAAAILKRGRTKVSDGLVEEHCATGADSTLSVMLP